MDVAATLTAARTLSAALQCAELRKLCSIFNYEPQLQKLLDIVKTIENFLLDADVKCRELTNDDQYWVKNLKDVFYDADDLLDEFNTVAHQLKRMPGGKITKKSSQWRCA
ncbi:uncharacterized protein [Spinacia oleracea]|uniref:Uncharacterized protein isoform X4 n=1 Tax=Spinacia oleracea TaxID=3562 RepID=A0ABM3RK08_SPIOL|nr:uncharacterized protein LOC110774909 isoform X4 [Spinacia oleracea]